MSDTGLSSTPMTWDDAAVVERFVERFVERSARSGPRDQGEALLLDLLPEAP